MKLGLARHFQIPHNKIRFLNAKGFEEWAEWYDGFEVSAREVPKAGPEWHKCYCSDLPRAHFTANWLFKGQIEKSPLLREVPFSPIVTTRVKAPLFLWEATSRVGWFLGHKSQSEIKAQTKERILEFLDMLIETHRKDNVLVVSHGFFMQYLEKELIRAGFRGKVPMHPKGGEIHLFEMD